ncbi:MAG: dUTP diphosphatase [Erysipelotrichaceae bacterium]|mgnify:CR=1 FL=1|nr:dUTP diphosphatase [Erysipelotrichaceae bacterium]
MLIRLKKINKDAKIPSYGSEFSAGADLYACEENEITIIPHETRLIHTGIAIEIPNGYVGLIYARSGLASKRDLAPANKVGVIDSDYRGEILVALHNHGNKDQVIQPFERIAQLVIAPVTQANFEEVEELNTTERNEGGFGSTGTR